MNTNTNPGLVNRRSDQNEIHALFVGPHLANAQKVFRRAADPVKCQHAFSPELALNLMMARANADPFDCVMIDMRHENDASPLNVVAISALYAANRVIVLANPDKVETFRDITGVDLVLPAPIDPRLIISTILDLEPVATPVEPSAPVVPAAPIPSIEDVAKTAVPRVNEEALKSIERTFEAELKRTGINAGRATPKPAVAPTVQPRVSAEPKVEMDGVPARFAMTTPPLPPAASASMENKQTTPLFDQDALRELQSIVTKSYDK